LANWTRPANQAPPFQTSPERKNDSFSVSSGLGEESRSRDFYFLFFVCLFARGLMTGKIVQADERRESKKFGVG